MDERLKRWARDASIDPEAEEAELRARVRANPGDLFPLWVLSRQASFEGEWMERLLAELSGRRSNPNCHPVIIDYSMTLEEMLARGEYAWGERDVLAQRRLPVDRRGVYLVQVEIRYPPLLAHLSEHEISLMRGGLPGANLELLLALGAMYPGLHRGSHILATGAYSPSQGWSNAVLLDWVGRSRGLRLAHEQHTWPDPCLLAVNRSSTRLDAAASR